MTAARKVKLARPVKVWAIVSPRGSITLNMAHDEESCKRKCVFGERITRVLITEIPARRKAK